jgi:putative phosphoribosyl transferase
VFRNRQDAGRQLAKKLDHYRGTNTVVLGLPRGGVPVAAEVARDLHLPLDIIGVRKLGVPGQEELAMGAIGEGGLKVMNEALLEYLRLSVHDIARVDKEQQRVLAERLATFRSGKPEVSLTGRTALIVDDGLATGATARVACQVARGRGALRVVLAVPVAPVEEAASFPEADEVVVVATPDPFFGVGMHYEVFDQTTDEEVVRLLRDSTADEAGEASSAPPEE